MTVIQAARGLFSPQVDRGIVNEGSEWITHALRAGDIGSAAHTLRERFGGLGLDDAVLGHAQLHDVGWSTSFTRAPRRDIAILDGPQRRLYSHHLESELRARGAEVTYLNAAELEFGADGTLRVGGAERAMPEAVFPTSGVYGYTKALDAFERGGAMVVNPRRAVLVGRNKNMGHAAYERLGISAPRGAAFLKTEHDLLEAAQRVGFDAVLKLPRSSGSQGVVKVRNEAELMDTARRWGHGAAGAAAHGEGLLLQEALDLGHEDVRFYGARDAETGVMRMIAATDRVGLDGEFLANGGAVGNMIRPIYDLSGGDPGLRGDMIAEALSAADKTGFDWVAGDIGRRRDTGKPVIIELDNYAHPAELNHPVPRVQQTFPHAADLLVYGDREALATRGAAGRAAAGEAVKRVTPADLAARARARSMG